MTVEDQRAAARPTTIFDVAGRAGVAISTVSAALNGKAGVSEATRERIRQVADEMGFVPSIRGKSLSSNRTFAVGLVVQRSADVLEEDPFFASFIGGIESVLGQRGYALILQMASGSEESLRHYREMISGRRVDGVFLNDLQVDDQRIGLVAELGAPAVAINAQPGRLPVSAVRQDYAAGIERLVNYLAGVGHRRFAYLGGPENFLHSTQRERAWRSALEALRLPIGTVFPGDFSYRSGREAADAIAASAPRATAVICANDLMAVGVMVRLQELGVRVPQDVSIAGYDGIPLGEYVKPKLTTLKTSPFELGARAATLLLDQVDGHPAEDVEITGAGLLLRDSTGPAPD